MPPFTLRRSSDNHSYGDTDERTECTYECSGFGGTADNEAFIIGIGRSTENESRPSADQQSKQAAVQDAFPGAFLLTSIDVTRSRWI